MNTLTPQTQTTNIGQRIRDAGIIAVLVIDELKHAVPVARALLAGGVNTIELTLRTPIALEAARVIRQEVPEIILGLGTVLTIEQVKEAIGVGADFAVAPGCNPRVLAEANRQGLFFGPGVMTPTDIEMAVEQGCRMLKYFPAETSGGMKHLENMVAPYQHLGLSFIPLGGINSDNARTYLQSPLIAAIGGSWVANRSLIQNENWDTVTHNAREITDLIQTIRSSAE